MMKCWPSFLKFHRLLRSIFLFQIQNTRLALFLKVKRNWSWILIVIGSFMMVVIIDTSIGLVWHRLMWKVETFLKSWNISCSLRCLIVRFLLWRFIYLYSNYFLSYWWYKLFDWWSRFGLGWNCLSYSCFLDFLGIHSRLCNYFFNLFILILAGRLRNFCLHLLVLILILMHRLLYRWYLCYSWRRINSRWIRFCSVYVAYITMIACSIC